MQSRDSLKHGTFDFKGTRILFQIIFLKEKSIIYAKITVSQNFFQKFSFEYYIGLLFS